MSDYKQAVRTYLVVLDTNVLLELYRFTPGARRELLDVLGRVKNRLWVPHQVAEEYYARRVDAVKGHIELYDSIPKKLEECRNKALQELRIFAKRCSLSEADKKRLLEPIEVAFSQTIAAVEKQGESFDLSLAAVISDDPVLAALAGLLDGKTGAPFAVEEVEALISQYEQRVENKTPPGYKDASKGENAHGDYFVWEQILREAATRRSAVLFVTNDAKEDWVRKEAGLVVGARPELWSEMQDRCGVDFLITQLGSFLKIAKEELGAAVSASTVAQAENIEIVPAGVSRVAMTQSEYRRVCRDLRANSKFWSEQVAELTHKIREGDHDSLREVGSAQEERDRSRLLLDVWSDCPLVRRGEHAMVQISEKDWKEVRAAVEAFRRRRNYRVRTRVGGSDLTSALGNVRDLEVKLSSLKSLYAKAEAEEAEITLRLGGIDSADSEHSRVNREMLSAKQHRISLGRQIMECETELRLALSDIEEYRDWEDN
ncbi:PIN-like domain-containing protein [Streptomyces sp. JJ36]|uniref:PIN-like domain-containing protein n=1 Tax=Streptomyces sp. JJ36 TaxID=2736645 RepID=UPI001F38432B|nr:PIN-like domain-containing protein [Streptomyces sp. JJ36]MCF6525586.1 DUF4935 domain-containing protein [Streptomyces sp. JJ36]